MNEVLDLLKELTDRDGKSIADLMLSLSEEVGELAAAIKVEQGTKNITLQESSMVEAVDVLICSLAVYFTQGGTRDDLAMLVASKLKKWAHRLKHTPVPPFMVMPMPLDKDGNGPASEADTVKIQWEVWDSLNLTVAKFDTKDQAIAEMERLDLNNCMEIKPFLNIVYHAAKYGREDYAIDVIFAYITNLLVAGKFETCDQILNEVDVSRLPPLLMASFLTITAAVKTKLKNRQRFFNLVLQVVTEQKGEAEAQALLRGLD